MASRALQLCSAGVACILAALSCVACSTTPRRSSAGPVRVVAAENFWGSIAAQVGGSGAAVTSLINQPSVDPHDYEPTPADARAIASADIVIVNGVGYDPWAKKLLAASPGSTVLDVGSLLGLKASDNPHRWYNPADVRRFIAALTADLSKIRPTEAARFTSNRNTFESRSLSDYDALIARIKAKYSGVAVGASESIFAMLAPSLGLDLITPPTFLKAVTEGDDVSAADKTTIDRQIATKRIKIYVYNSQNATPDIQEQLKACRDKGIPTATITETLTPATDTYEQWQSHQLRGIAAALAEATGR